MGTEMTRGEVRLSRRALLGSAALTAGGAAAAGFGIAQVLDEPAVADVGHPVGQSPAAREAQATGQVEPADGIHQAGIETAQQTHALLLAGDLTVLDAGELRGLLQDLTATITAITQGQDPPTTPLFTGGAEVGTDFATGLSPARLTVTVGLGPRVFEIPGVRQSPPSRLRPLPAFDGDGLDPLWSDGDLLLQICADDPQVVSWAHRSLRARLPGRGRLRWTQAGFLSVPAGGQTPRNMFGHKDGTSNPPASSPEFAATVWARDDEPAWFAGGTYLVFRKIRMKTADWDLSARREQDRVIGRRRTDGSPLTGRDEHDVPDLDAVGSDGEPVIPKDAHIRRVGGFPMHRRSYSYDYGQLIATAGGKADPTAEDDDHAHAPGTPEHTHGGHNALDVGLLFCAYGNDPDAQFIPAQRASAESDRLSAFVQHTGSAIFAVLPGFAEGGYLGDTLLG